MSMLATFLPVLKPWAEYVQLQSACCSSGAGRPYSAISGELAVEAAAAQVTVVLKSIMQQSCFEVIGLCFGLLAGETGC